MKRIPVLCTVCLLLAAGPTSAAGCENWNTKEFFKTATPKAVTDCLQSGADLNARTKHGHTPLHQAAALNHTPAVLIRLLNGGANPAARDVNGKIPWDYANKNLMLKDSDVYWRLNEGRF